VPAGTTKGTNKKKKKKKKIEKIYCDHLVVVGCLPPPRPILPVATADATVMRV
jgi:hypothetical protein